MFWRKRTKKYEDPFEENTITVVHREESSPASTMRFVIAALFLVLAAITIGQQLYFQGQRSSDLKAQQKIDKDFQANQEKLNAQLQQQITDADLDRERLRTLVLGVLTARTPEESRKILEKFIAETARQRRVSPTPKSSPTFKSSSNPRPSPQPKPRPSSSRKPGPKPKPTHSPTAHPSPSRTPVCVVPIPAPLPKPPIVCT